VEVLAVEERFAATVLAPSDVELVLAVVVQFVVRIEWTHEQLYLLHLRVTFSDYPNSK
jgi:hypothetical protein